MYVCHTHTYKVYIYRAKRLFGLRAAHRPADCRAAAASTAVRVFHRFTRLDRRRYTIQTRKIIRRAPPQMGGQTFASRR